VNGLQSASTNERTKHFLGSFHDCRAALWHFNSNENKSGLFLRTRLPWLTKKTRPLTLATTKQEQSPQHGRCGLRTRKSRKTTNVKAERALCECAHGCGLPHGSSNGRSQSPLSQIEGIERHNAFFGNNEEPCVSGNTNEIKHRFSMSSSSAIPACLLRTVLLFQLSCFERPLQGDLHS
jgi:hypothetical protein